MDFILNSKTKKVEIFYENAIEQQAILNFMSQYLTYKEDKTAPNTYINDPGISWTNAVSGIPYTISTISATDNLSGTITLDNSTINVAKLESNIQDSITAAATKLDTKTNNDDAYSCLVAAVPRKTK